MKKEEFLVALEDILQTEESIEENQNLDNFEEQQEGMLNKYALVLTSIKGIGVKTFSYLIPDEMKALKAGFDY